MIKTLIDTDIGDDIDDALALTYAIKSGKLDVVGVTTVFKNTSLRARQAKKLLQLCDADEIPVYAGVGQPICGGLDTNEIFCQYTDDLSSPKFDYNNMDDDSGDQAVEYIIKMAETHRDELTLLMIGPYTNLAKAIKKNPQAISKVNRIVIMGGAFSEQFLEWNILCDPEAANIVFESGIPLFCVGVDVTTKCILSNDEIDLLCENNETELHRYIGQLVRLWVKASGRKPILHDPLAVHAVIDGQYLEFEERVIKVELNGDYTRGMTVDINNCQKFNPFFMKKSSIQIGTEVNPQAFIQDFFETIYSKNNLNVSIKNIKREA